LYGSCLGRRLLSMIEGSALVASLLSDLCFYPVLVRCRLHTERMVVQSDYLRLKLRTLTLFAPSLYLCQGSADWVLCSVSKVMNPLRLLKFRSLVLGPTI